ncbi:unnamed protein product [Hermetia illucens]|uniref:NADH dehydrogenase [ubiquinone] 1 alpha subcomplex subunit 1 n=1 Tax=Hermetia illucens TaxID=343691 RepID=A0A7R8V2R1_HERIL|nr:NADH dehydrogenase [ubiquinone] 1 alpha subcomplex subunit 1 [Hermetia illucens]CAD7091781.1 unnamed protein product [Hermetia illucens]
MWYEILPSAGIILTFMTIPGFAMYGLNKLVLGNGYRRNMDLRFNRMMYQRDMRLTGDPYKQNGLNAVDG